MNGKTLLISQQYMQRDGHQAKVAFTPNKMLRAMRLHTKSRDEIPPMLLMSASEREAGWLMSREAGCQCEPVIEGGCELPPWIPYIL